MDNRDIGKPVRVVMKDGHAKTGKLVIRTEKSITIRFENGDVEELFLDSVSSIKINENGWLYGRNQR